MVLEHITAESDIHNAHISSEESKDDAFYAACSLILSEKGERAVILGAALAKSAHLPGSSHVIGTLLLNDLESYTPASFARDLAAVTAQEKTFSGTKKQGRGVKRAKSSAPLFSQLLAKPQLSYNILYLAIALARSRHLPVDVRRHLRVFADKLVGSYRHCVAWFPSVQTLDHVLALEFESDHFDEVTAFQELAFKHNLTELALAPRSWLTNPEECSQLLGEIPAKDLSDFSYALQKPDYNVCELVHALQWPKIAPVMIGDHQLDWVDTGTLYSREDLIVTSQSKLYDILNEKLRAAIDPLPDAQGVGAAKVSGYKIKGVRKLEDLPASPNIAGPQELVEIAVADDELNEQGEFWFKRLTPGSVVALADGQSERLSVAKVAENNFPRLIIERQKKDQMSLLLAADISSEWRQLQAILHLQPDNLPVWVQQAVDGGELRDGELHLFESLDGGLESLPEIRSTDRRTLVISTSLPESLIFGNDIVLTAAGNNTETRLTELRTLIEGEADPSLGYETSTINGLMLAAQNLQDTEQYRSLAKLQPLGTLSSHEQQRYLLSGGADLIRLTLDEFFALKPTGFDDIIVSEAHGLSRADLLELLASSPLLKSLTLVGRLAAQSCSGVFQELSRLRDTRLLPGNPYKDSIFLRAGAYYPELKLAGYDDPLPGFEGSTALVKVSDGVALPELGQHTGTASLSVALLQYMQRARYPHHKLLLLAETAGQKDMVEELLRVENIGVKVTSDPYAVADYTIVSLATENSPEKYYLSGRKGLFIFSPGPESTPLSLIAGEIYPDITDPRVAVTITSLDDMLEFLRGPE